MNKGWATTPYFIGAAGVLKLHLVRHSQAGPRGNQAELSVPGLQQTQLLADHFAQQALRFDAIYVGSIQRQQFTAYLVHERLSQPTEIFTDECWNEFKLGAAKQSSAAHLCKEKRDALVKHPF